MRNKLINHLLLLSNVLFILGLTISIILINKRNITFSDVYQIDRLELLKDFAPFIVFFILSLISCTFFAIERKKYFNLVKNHITKKTLTYFNLSIYMLFFNIALAVILMFYGMALWKTDANLNFYKNIYLYLILGIEMFLTLVDTFFDAICKLKIKVDLANKRTDAYQNKIEANKD